jgi:hypothetical protein
VGAAGVWWAAGGAGYPFGGDDLAGAGSLVAGAGAEAGGTALAAAGAAGVAVAAAAAWRGAPPGAARVVEVAAWLLAAAGLLVVTDVRLLMALGYLPLMPVLLVAVDDAGQRYADQFLTWPMAAQAAAVALGAVWAAAALAHRRRTRGACGRCGRTGADPAVWAATRERARQWGLVATVVGVACALVYPINRIPWLFGLPMSMSAEDFAAFRTDPVGLLVGVGLGCAGICGAVLMVGLVRPWGTVFPRLLPGLAGRRVPVAAAVVPAAVAATVLVIAGRGVFAVLLSGGFGPVSGWAGWLGAAGTASFLPWGVALAVAAGAYALRRRGVCAACGRGLPEPAGGPVRA